MPQDTPSQVWATPPPRGPRTCPGESLAEGARVPSQRGPARDQVGGKTYRPGEKGTCTAP